MVEVKKRRCEGRVQRMIKRNEFSLTRIGGWEAVVMVSCLPEVDDE